MSSESHETSSVPNPPELSALDTRIDELRNRFPFIDTFKQSDRSRHYIVQDLDQDANSPNPYFFLKQCFFKDEAEFRFAFDYYKKYQHYCRGPFAKNDIIRLHQIYFAENAEQAYFELALIMDIGEPDRIDIEHIQPEQITKFLRTVCSLLEDVKKQENMPHGNICLKNIVLMGGELKISGFKPVYLGPGSPRTWKTELCSRFSHFRADLYMIGLLWLKFLGAPIEDLTQKGRTLDELDAAVQKILEETPDEKRVAIVNNLLDLAGHPDLTLEEIIREFEEWLVIDHYNRSTEKDPEGGGSLNVFDIDPASQSDRYSLAARPHSRPDGDNNPFLQTMNQSEEERVTLDHEAHDDPATVKFKNPNDYLKIDGEFTLQDDDSMMLQTGVKSSDLQPVGRALSNERSPDVLLKDGFFEGVGANLVSSEKRLSTIADRPDEDTVNSLRNIKGEMDSYGLGQPAPFKKDSKVRVSTADRVSQNSEPSNYMKIEGDTSGTHLSKTLPDHADTDSQMSLEGAINLQDGLGTNYQSTPGGRTEDLPDRKRTTQASNRVAGDLRTSQRSNPVVQGGSERKEWVNAGFVPAKVELSEEQLEQIEQQAVQKYIGDKEEVQQKSVDNIIDIQAKHEAAALRSEKLKEKIQELSEKKIAQKKADKPSPTLSKDSSAKSDKKGKGAPAPKQPEKKVAAAPKLDSADGSKKGKDPREPVTPSSKVGSTLPISQRPKNTKYGMLNDPKKPFGLSTVRERDGLFSYTHDMQNKNISFKKMLKKVEPAQKQASYKPDEVKTTTRLVSAEPPKAPAPTLEGLVAETDIQKKTGPLPKTPSRAVSEIRAETSMPPFLDYIAAFALRPVKPSPKSETENGEAIDIDSMNNLEVRYSNSETPKDIERRVSKALRDDQLPQAIQTIQVADGVLQADPDSHIRIYTQLYSYFKRKGLAAPKKATLYELVDILGRNKHLDESNSLQQELILELAQMEAEEGHLQLSLRLLQTEPFDSAIYDPELYYSLLGEAFVGLHDDRSAAATFQRLLNERISDSFVHFDMTRLFTLTFRVFQLLHRSGNQLKLARFFLKMLGAFQDIKRVNQVLHLKDNDYQNLIEIFVLNTLRFAREVGDLNLLNFVLHEAVAKKLLDHEANMNDEERNTLVLFITEFCGHLSRLVNFGGFRDNYLAYLEYAKEVLKASELSAESLKRELAVNFALAVHYLRAEDYPAAQEVLNRTISSYFAFFKRPDPAMFEVLFELGENLAKKEKFGEARWYFQRILELNCSEGALRLQALKELAKAEFRVAGFPKTIEHIEVFLDHHFDKAEASSYWKYLTLLFVAAVKVDPKKLEPVYNELAQNQTPEGGRVFGFYLQSFKALQDIFAVHHEFKENAKHLAPIEAVAKGSKTTVPDSPKIFQAFADLYFKYIGGKVPAGGSSSKAFLQRFVDPHLTVTENAHLLLGYLLNITFAFVSLVPTFKERVFNHDQRQRLFDSFKANLSKEVLVHYLNESIKVNNYEQVESKEAINASKLASTLVQSRPMDRTPSADLLASVTKDPSDCACRPAYNGSVELQKLAKEFLKKIEQSLFRDQFEDVLAYYARFEKSLMDRGIAFQKFDFVQQLITFHLASVKKNGIDRLRFEALLSQMFGPTPICWHDLKLVVLVLESFKDPLYLRILAQFLDANHPNYAKIVFNDVFLNSFNRKFERLVADLFRAIQENRFAAIESHFFVPHLEFEEHGKPVLAPDFAPFSRLRYSVLFDESLLPVFNRHVNFDEVVKFYLRFHLFNGLKSALEASPATANETLRKFKNELLGLLIRLRIEESHIVDLLYHVLLVARVTRFESPDEMCDSFLKIVQFLLDRYNFRMNYQYSRVLAELGRVFYRSLNFLAALRAFMIAGTLLEDTNNVHPYEPSYVVPAQREVHIFETQVFIVASLLEQKNFDNVLIYLQRLEKVKTESEILKLDRKILTVMCDLGFKKTSQALKIIFGELSRMADLPLTDVQRKLYTAVFDKLSLWVVRQTEKNEKEVKQSEAKARNSTLDLYK